MKLSHLLYLLNFSAVIDINNTYHKKYWPICSSIKVILHQIDGVRRIKYIDNIVRTH